MLTDTMQPRTTTLTTPSGSTPVVPPGTDAPAAVATWAEAAERLPWAPAALDVLLARLPVGIVLTDRHGRVAYANGSARRLGAGYPGAPGDRAGAPLREKLEWRVARVLLTSEVVCYEEIDTLGADGSRSWLGVGATPVRGVDGAITGCVLTLEDATARKRLAAFEPMIESLSRL
jgi:PAS domain-containing protein